MAPGEFHAVVEAATRALEDAVLTWSDVAGMGVVVAGLVDSSAGVVLDSANLGWHGLPLWEELHRQVGVPVLVENDVCASALAEFAGLRGRTPVPWLYISVGTGVGACLVLDKSEGQLLCLDVGHIPIPEGSRRCTCGKYGCLETVASGASFTEGAKARIAADPAHTLNSRLATITGGDVLDAATEGDRTCLEVVTAAGRACGVAVANLVNLLTPGGVGLAGRMLVPGSPYLESLIELALKEVKPWLKDRFPFYIAILGDRAGVIGAVELAKSRLAERSASGVITA
jgi:glucokinase